VAPASAEPPASPKPKPACGVTSSAYLPAANFTAEGQPRVRVTSTSSASKLVASGRTRVRGAVAAVRETFATDTRTESTAPPFSATTKALERQETGPRPS
jgi:hypothetical protein